MPVLWPGEFHGLYTLYTRTVLSMGLQSPTQLSEFHRKHHMKHTTIITSFACLKNLHASYFLRDEFEGVEESYTGKAAAFFVIDR